MWLLSSLTALGCAQLFPREGGLEQKISGWGLDLGCLQQPGEVARLRGKGRLRQCCHLLVSPAWLSLHCHLTKPRAPLEILCCNWALEMTAETLTCPLEASATDRSMT